MRRVLTLQLSQINLGDFWGPQTILWDDCSEEMIWKIYLYSFICSWQHLMRKYFRVICILTKNKVYLKGSISKGRILKIQRGFCLVKCPLFWFASQAAFFSVSTNSGPCQREGVAIILDLSGTRREQTSHHVLIIRVPSFKRICHSSFMDRKGFYAY